jgi:hypothetical protein
MVKPTAEVLFDRPVSDPHEWQPIESLARSLGIAERTVRHRAQAGSLERVTIPNGRTYYRAPPSSVPDTASTSPPETETASSLIVQLSTTQRDLAAAQVSAARLETEHRATVERLETTAGQLETERQRVERLEDERQRLTASLEDERHHARQQAARLETLATLTAALTAAPWYAFGRRRQLRRQLESVTTGAPVIPALPAPTEPA